MTDTKIKAQGAKGDDAIAPQVQINATTNEWEISTDQSDLQWMQAEQQEDGTFWMNIDVPEFNYKTGEYHIDVYLVDADGNQNIVGSTIGVVY